MKRMTRAWLIAAATLLPFVVLALVIPPLLDLTGALRWVAPLAFLVLGLVAAVVVLVYLRARAKALPEPAPADDEIDSAVVQARKRLAAAKNVKLGATPLVLFVGPSGSTKTTVITRSGLDPELLAGEVHRGDAVVPTRAINVWFAEDAVFLEAGGKLVNDPARWGRLIRHLQPSRLSAILPKGRQAPRMAVVCFGCDEFLKPGASGSVPALAQTLRARLVEVAAQLGIRLPIYVVFTRADRLPYFDDFVRSMTRDEVSELLGTTLPVEAGREAGSYAERAAGRLGGAFEGMFRALALRRLEVLPRESAEDVRAGAYEFPRELRKVVPLATQFLVDLCRPSQLTVSPFLRGFYFTGVRAVMVEDTASAPASRPSSASTAVDATSVFDPRAVLAQQRQAPTPGGARKVPEWTFLRRLLGGLVLRDPIARAVTAGGTRVNLLRRALVGGTAAALVLLSVALFVSWRYNDGLIDGSIEAARGVEAVDLAAVGVPPVDDLVRLDSLRSRLERLRAWDVDAPPLRYRWGLYAGGEMLDTLRALYFQRFDRMLWTYARSRLLASLGGLPATPTEANEYGSTYDALKAYLITTSHPRESTVEFLAPALMEHWSTGRDVDPERAALAERQFAFYAAELPFGDPFDRGTDDALVARTRNFLRLFGDTAQFYQALIGEASQAAEAARFGPTETVSDAFVVPGAYTKGGWEFVQRNLQNVDQLFARESWVLGDAAVPEGDRARIASELQQRYIADYIAHWQQYLADARVARFGGAQDASRKLDALSSPQSPLLRLLALAAQHTAVDTATVDRAFQPVHAVVPPTATDRLIVEPNQPYMQGLVGLRSAMEQVASAQGPERQSVIGNASSTADQITQQVRGMALEFNSTGPAQAVAADVERLLLSPVQNVEGLLSALPAAGVNANGASFCQRLTPVTRKYPFSQQASAEASVDEVSAALRPGSSALWSYYDEQLQGRLVREGEQYAAAIGATLRPTAEFVAFFNRAAEASRALYSQDGAGPEVVFEMRPLATEQVPEVRVEIDNENHVVNRTMQASRTFVWQAERARSARIIANVGGAQLTVASVQGPWAIFRVFQQANWERIGPGHYRLQWRVPTTDATLAAELRFDKRIPIFMPGYLDNLDCVARVVAR